MKTVINLNTGDEYYYDSNIKPDAAVMSAALYVDGNTNTWDYPTLFTSYGHELVWGKKTVSFRDFACRIDS